MSRSDTPRLLERWANTRKRSVRDIIRRHLYHNRMTIKGDLSRILGLTPGGAATLMTKTHDLPARQIDQFCNAMSLDDFDRTELHRQAAREAGFRIDGPSL